MNVKELVKKDASYTKVIWLHILGSVSMKKKIMKIASFDSTFFRSLGLKKETRKVFENY